MSQPLRILTVVRDLGAGGTQRAAQNYALGYSRAGHGSAVLALLGGGPRVAALAEVGLDVFVGGAGPAHDRAVAQAAAWAPTLVHVHRVGGPDPSTAPALLGLAEALPGARFVETNVFSRADPTATGRLFDVHLQLTRWCLWKWRRWSRGIHPRPLGAVLPYVADPDAFYPDPAAARAFRQAHGVPSDAVLFGRIGQPLEPKWMPALVEAFGEVARDRPAAWLLLVGAPPSVQARVRRLAPTVRARVRTLDFLHGDPALRAAYSALDVFVLAAHKGESFGMVLAESLLCRTPAVVLSRPARDNSQVEVVGHERGGLVAADARGMAEAMALLADDPERRTRLGCGGAARIRDRYAFDAVMPVLLRIVSLVVASPTRDDLRRALDAEPGVVTDVADAEIAARLARSIGTAPWHSRLATWAVHQPALVRLWRRVRA